MRSRVSIVFPLTTTHWGQISMPYFRAASSCGFEPALVITTILRVAPRRADHSLSRDHHKRPMLRAVQPGTPDLAPGTLIGGEFRIVGPLSSGGMGAVYV